MHDGIALPTIPGIEYDRSISDEDFPRRGRSWSGGVIAGETNAKPQPPTYVLGALEKALVSANKSASVYTESATPEIAYHTSHILGSGFDRSGGNVVR